MENRNACIETVYPNCALFHLIFSQTNYCIVSQKKITFMKWLTILQGVYLRIQWSLIFTVISSFLLDIVTVFPLLLPSSNPNALLSDWCIFTMGIINSNTSKHSYIEEQQWNKIVLNYDYNLDKNAYIYSTLQNYAISSFCFMYVIFQSNVKETIIF